MDWGAIAGGGGLVGGIPFLSTFAETGVNAYMQDKTNKQNRELAENANATSANMAQNQMNFQERMSNSAYQRQMEDMRKAGLNPILAYSGGGASTPSGAQGSITAPKMETPKLSGLASSALSAVQLAQDQQKNQSTIDLQKQQALQTAAGTQKALADTERTKISTQLELAAGKRAEEIHHNSSSSRQLEKMEADFSRDYFEYQKANKLIQQGAGTIESLGDAFYSTIGGKVFGKSKQPDRGANSARDIETYRNRGSIPAPQDYYKVHKKTGEILNPHDL